jgi:hypothetical protein
VLGVYEVPREQPVAFWSIKIASTAVTIYYAQRLWRPIEAILLDDRRRRRDGRDCGAKRIRAGFVALTFPLGQPVQYFISWRVAG